jgi:hypothetical protein
MHPGSPIHQFDKLDYEEFSDNPETEVDNATNETREAIPEEWMEPARRFRNNNYPCPRCGKQLPRYGEGIHL